MANKFYGLLTSKVDKKATGVIRGYITKKSDMTLQQNGETKWLRFALNVSNQGKNFEYLAEKLGATVSHMQNGDNVNDLINVVAFGVNAELFGKRKCQPGDEVIVFVEFVPNEYNGKTTVQATNAQLIDVRRRKTSDVDASTESTATSGPDEVAHEVEEPLYEISEDDIPF